MMCRCGARQSRGAALIIALMIVALVAVIGSSMGIEYLITVKRASNQLVGEQAYSYGIAAEAFAVKVLGLDLLEDAKANETIDALDEFWAQDAPPFQTAEGAYGGKLYDLSGRFNVNVLLNQQERMSAGDNKNVQPIASLNEARFVCLLRSLSDDDGEFVVQEEDAVAIMQAVVDWLDSNIYPTGFGGAEDDFYGGIEGRPAYRAANGPMVSPSELLLVAHMTPEIYKRLLPHVTVWPRAPIAATGAAAGININTATENVLRCLNVKGKQFEGVEPAPREEVAPILRQQQQGGYTQEQVAGVLPGGGDAGGVVVKSDYFLLDGHVTIGDVATHMQSVISRKDNKVQVILRTTGGL